MADSHRRTSDSSCPLPPYTKIYMYLLELSGDRIIGGEWLEDSIMNHPDYFYSQSLTLTHLDGLNLITDHDILLPNLGGFPLELLRGNKAVNYQSLPDQHPDMDIGYRYTHDLL